MLLTSQVIKSKSKESEAFSATIDQFGIRLEDISSASGVSVNMLRRFKGGDTSSFKSAWLTQVVWALSPDERNFYNSMISLQHATEDARVPLPLLDFDKVHSASDVYRQALEKLVKVFSIDMAFICRSCGIKESNVSAWRRGNSDMEIDNLNKIKAVLSPEQRNFYFAIVDVLYALSVPKKTERATQLSLVA